MSEKLIGLNEAGRTKLTENSELWVSKNPELSKFTARFFDASTLSPDDFIHKQHVAAFKAWLDIRDGDPFPCRKKLDPISMPQALGDLILLSPEIKDGKQDFRFRLYGTHIAQRFDRDMTGKYISDFHTMPPKAMMEQYIDLLEKKIPFYAEHDAPPEISSMVRWCRLVLPLAEDCETNDFTISRILVCNIPVDQPVEY